MNQQKMVGFTADFVLLSYTWSRHHTQDGATPLLVASAKGNKEIVEVLIHKGADSNLQDKVM